MLFTDYLDEVQNTEEEARLFEVLAKLRDGYEEAVQVPVMGKAFAAVVALYDLGSIEEFKQSEHFDNMQGWNLEVNLNKDEFIPIPGDEFIMKAVKVVGVIGAGVAVLLLLRKLKRRRRRIF